jgi:hypothetical protein
MTVDETSQAPRPAYAAPCLMRLTQPGGTLAACSPGSNLSPSACSNDGLNAALTCNNTGITADLGCISGTSAGGACEGGQTGIVG